MSKIDIRWKTKFGLVGILIVLLTLLSVTVVFAQDECPGDYRIYIGGPVSDANAKRGTQFNPVANRDEAEALCIACGGGAYLYEYNTVEGIYAYYDVCATVFPESSGSPMAQSVFMGLLVLGALALLGWGFYTRLRLKRA